MSIINSSVIIRKPSDDPADTIYTVSVAVMDMAGRIGEESEILCFTFQGKNRYSLLVPLLYLSPCVAPVIQAVYTNGICGTNVTIQWTVEVKYMCMYPS